MQHVTVLEGPDSAGHYGWSCTGCPAEATGYDDGAEVTLAAEDHGPLAADSLRLVTATSRDGDTVTAPRGRIAEVLADAWWPDATPDVVNLLHVFQGALNRREATHYHETALGFRLVRH